MRNRIPGQLVIQTTNHCNARCPQCGMRATADIPRKRLNTEQIKRILDAAAKKGVKAVSFTGGEPFLFQDDLIRLINYASEISIPYIRTGTNGFIFRRSSSADFVDRIKALADRLAAAGLRNFWISLDSAVPEVHEKMRGLAGVVRGIEKALPIFQAAGLFPSANLGLNRMVGGHFVESPVFSLLRSLFGCFLPSFQGSPESFLRPRPHHGFYHGQHLLPHEHQRGRTERRLASRIRGHHCRYGSPFHRPRKGRSYKVLLDTIPDHRRHRRIFSPLSSIYALHRRYLHQEDPAAAFGCRGGIDFFFIDANDGDTYPCGYRGRENLDKFWRLELECVKQENNCRSCDWECFRDPSELCAPLLQALHRPLQLARHMFRDKLFRPLWMEDIRYYYACEYFDARRSPNFKRLNHFKPK
jgi:MoaA/NifB/PqqE/SkfB family radical SAM enzyme